MPRKLDISHAAAVQWLIHTGAEVSFGKKDGANHIVLRTKDRTFTGFDFIDLVERAKDSAKRRKHFESREAVMDEFGSWLKENV